MPDHLALADQLALAGRLDEAARFRQRVEQALADLPPPTPLPHLWRALGESGVPAGLYRRGGPLGPVAEPAHLAALLRAVDARGDNGVTLGVLVQAASAVPVLGSGAGDACGTAYQRVLAGTATVALAATDAAAPGSDLAGLGTEVTIDERGLTLRGGKRWITAACCADYLLVLARQRPGRHFTSFSWVLVPADADGLTVRAADTDLLAGSGTGHVEFDDVRLPADHLVGRPGRGLAVFARHMGTERLAGAYWAVALTSRVLAETQARLARRTVDGRPLWQHEAIRQDLATCLVKVAGLRALHESLGEQIVERQDLAAAALLKSAVGLTVDAVLSRCAQLQGADGLARGGVQQIRAEAGVCGIGGGATELMLSHVADSAEQLLEGLRS
ncbi:alkylation response protein AidB-like acyl-CoA dehydrogenase [Kitasatospora sp. MAP12-15]|uniref:acyl-CoA dehydrogenase family protein n=1 Tax=unclassified Kitasatospora TaxID=2633591 RepID=UPI002476B6D1|nr:acyl-CoA dehydrogenase family protein [Kitasatospora sp. MAP12-44]MDH6113888.1 alkylation response protein AidB-like acyl-CoA dehydrogenase [Kitasatospora sp. MAP12-44]